MVFVVRSWWSSMGILYSLLYKFYHRPIIFLVYVPSSFSHESGFFICVKTYVQRGQRIGKPFFYWCLRVHSHGTKRMVSICFDHGWYMFISEVIQTVRDESRKSSPLKKTSDSPVIYGSMMKIKLLRCQMYHSHFPKNLEFSHDFPCFAMISGRQNWGGLGGETQGCGIGALIKLWLQGDWTTEDSSLQYDTVRAI